MTRRTNLVEFALGATEALGVPKTITGEGDHDAVDDLSGANLDVGDAVGSPHIPCRPSVATPRSHLDHIMIDATTPPPSTVAVDASDDWSTLNLLR